MDVTIKKLGTSSNGPWVLLVCKQKLTFGEANVSAFIGVDDNSQFTEGQQLTLTTKEFNMITWRL